MIWSAEHRAYWRTNGFGYTTLINAAGVYRRDEAERQTRHCGPEKQIEIQLAPSRAPTAWTDLPKEVLDDMEWLGNFGPTVNVANRELKGRMVDSDGDVGKVYLEAGNARRLAKSLNAVADWLDARADAPKSA